MAQSRSRAIRRGNAIVIADPNNNGLHYVRFLTRSRNLNAFERKYMLKNQLESIFSQKGVPFIKQN